jgi:hypothetical protein
MNRIINFIFGRPPIAGVEYSMSDCGPNKTITADQISNGIVRVTYYNLDDSYLTYRQFHFCYSRQRNKLKNKFEQGKL